MFSWMRLLSMTILSTLLVSTQVYALQVGSLNLPFAKHKKLNLAQANAAQSPLVSAGLNAGRFGKTTTELARKAAGLTGAGLKTMAQETTANVFQSYVIVIALAIAELTKMRMERDRLLDGQTIKYEEVTNTVTTATDDVLCANGSGGKDVQGVITEMSCSGEFWFATLAGTSGNMASQFLLNAGTAFLFKGAGGLLRKMIVGIVSSFLMLAGFQVSGYVWSQAVNFLEDDKASVAQPLTRNQKLAQAHGILPRAILQMIGGRWNQYVLTADGRVAKEIFQNMYNMILLDDKMRATFMDNVWRFGIARGQFVENLILMSAILPASSAVAAGTVWGITATASAMGVSAAGTTAASGGTVLIGAIVATIFCATVISISVMLPDSGFAQAFDNAMQDLRSWSAGSNHQGLLQSMDWNSIGFKAIPEGSAYFFGGEYEIYRANFARDLDDLAGTRAEWVKVAIEKYQELRIRVEQAEHMVLVLDEVLKNSKLRNAILFGAAGTQMTYAQAKDKFCRKPRMRGPVPNCEFPLSLQLQKLEESRRTAQEGRKYLDGLALQIVNIYYDDMVATQKLMDNSELNFPEDVALKLARQNDMAEYLVAPMAFYFGSYHKSVTDVYTDVYFSSPDEQQITQSNANEFIGRAYINGMDEADLLERLEAAQAL